MTYAPLKRPERAPAILPKENARKASATRSRDRSGSSLGSSAARFNAASLPLTPAESVTPPESLGPTRPLDVDDRQWLEASTGPLPALKVHDGPQAHQVVGAFNAHAATYGAHVAARPGGLSGETGRYRLAHEVAHVLQQSRSDLSGGDADAAERDANEFARAVVARRPAGVAVSAPVGWAFDAKQIQAGDSVAELAVFSSARKVRVTMLSGDVFEFKLTTNTLAPGSYTGLLKNGAPRVQLVGSSHEQPLVLYFIRMKGSPDPRGLRFPASFTVTVAEGAVSRVPGATPEGSSASRSTDGGGGSPAGDGATGATNGPPAQEERLPVTPPPVLDGQAPVVQLSDPKQLEELKRRGLIPATTADQIESKLEKQETLSFEEAVALLDALGSVVQQGGGTEGKGTGESWLRWARFVEENKGKLSGKAGKSAGGLTVDDVNELLKKHKEFVGAKDIRSRSTRSAVHDPELRKSWNSLTAAEKELWNEYNESYGDTADVTDPSTKDLRITAAVRFGMALRMSPKYMPSGRQEAAKALFNDSTFIAGTIAGITIYLGLWLTPEPVFTKATAVLTTIGLMSLVAFSATELKNLASAWMRLDSDAAQASTLPELEAAAERFGKSVGGSELRILVALATVLVGKALPAPKPLPPPMGGGGMMAAAAGGPSGLIAVPVAVPAVMVRPDGAIVIIGGPLSGLSMSSDNRGRGGGDYREGRGRDRERQRRREESRTGADEEYEVPASEKPAQTALPEMPKGLRPKQWERFRRKLFEGLTEAGYTDVKATVQGSGATGKKFKGGAEFDQGRVSDYDVALDSPSLLSKAKSLEIPLNGPLSDRDVGLLGLQDMRNGLNAATQRDVNFLIVDPNAAGMILNRPGIPVPP